MVCPRLPWPLDDGGRVGLWQIAWSAAREFETTLFCLVPPGTEADPLPEVFAEAGLRVVRIPHRLPPTLLAAALGVAGPWPFTLQRYRSRVLAERLATTIAQERPRFVLANGLHAATYGSALGGTPHVYRAHNLEALWMERYAGGLPRGPRRLYAAHQARRLRRTESEIARRAALVLAISDAEAEALRHMAPGARVETLPLGIDVSAYPAPAPASPPIVIVLGTWSWPPNADGATRFLREGWPAVQRRAPQARLRLVGKDPSPALRAAAERAGAEVTGRVPSVQDELRRAAALAVPLWAGAGVRVKIVEAMAAGVPVVSTPLGAEGLGLRAGEDYLAGDGAEALGSALGDLLGDAAARERLSARGLGLARERWSLEATARRQNALCREATTAAGAP